MVLFCTNSVQKEIGINWHNTGIVRSELNKSTYLQYLVFRINALGKIFPIQIFTPFFVQPKTFEVKSILINNLPLSYLEVQNIQSFIALFLAFSPFALLCSQISLF